MLCVLIAIVILEILCVWGLFGSWFANACASICPDWFCPEKVYDWNSPDVFTARSDNQLWRSRENGEGYPFYWRVQYEPGFLEKHPELYNHLDKHRSYFRNVMYLE